MIKLIIIFLFIFINYGFADNIILNYDFEQGSGGAPLWWGTYRNLSATTFNWDTTGGKNSSHCIKITETVDNNIAYFYQVVNNITAEKFYTISGWIKTYNLTSASGLGASIKIEYYDSNNIMIGDTSMPYLGATTDWEYVIRSFYTPANTDYIKVLCLLEEGIGTAYFDNIVLETDGNIIREKTYTDPVEFSSDELFPYIDITSFISKANLFIGYIDIQFIIFAYNGLENTWGMYYDDDDINSLLDMKSSCDGIKYDMITAGYKKSGNLTTTGGLQSGSSVVLRFSVPPQIYEKYLLYIGNNFYPVDYTSTLFKIYAIKLDVPAGPCAKIICPTKCVKGEPVEFSAGEVFNHNCDAPIIEYEWDFGDNSEGSGSSVMHTYNKTGKYTISLNLKDGNGNTREITKNIEVVSDINITKLKQSYPNPFDMNKYPDVKIPYELSSESDVDIIITTISGEQVMHIKEGRKRKGFWKAIWDGKNETGEQVYSGLYFYILKTDSDTKIGKLVVYR